MLTCQHASKVVTMRNIIPAKHQHFTIFVSVLESRHYCSIPYNLTELLALRNVQNIVASNNLVKNIFTVHTNMKGNGHSNSRPQGEAATNPLKDKNEQNAEIISMPYTKLLCKMCCFFE